MDSVLTFWMVLSTRTGLSSTFNDKISAVKNAIYAAEVEAAACNAPGSVQVIEIKIVENPLDADGKPPTYRHGAITVTVLTL